MSFCRNQLITVSYVLAAPCSWSEAWKNVFVACQTVSGLPEPAAQTVLLTQDDSVKKSSTQKKKKDRERGKVGTPWR